MDFEWDPRKNAANLKKHRIDFEDAIGVFERFTLRKRSDRRGEARFVAIGELDGRIVAVVYTMRGATLRLISARRARYGEIDAYRQAIAGRSA